MQDRKTGIIHKTGIRRTFRLGLEVRIQALIVKGAFLLLGGRKLKMNAQKVNQLKGSSVQRHRLPGPGHQQKQTEKEVQLRSSSEKSGHLPGQGHLQRLAVKEIQLHSNSVQNGHLPGRGRNQQIDLRQKTKQAEQGHQEVGIKVK